jgi:Pyridoxamine 5'-phosphate oxidase like
VLAAQCGRRFPSKRRNSINDQWSARRREMLESPAYRVLSQSAHRAISRLELELCYHGGRARIVDDPAQIHALWSEGFRVWFPDGPDSPNIALLAIDVEVIAEGKIFPELRVPF